MRIEPGDRLPQSPDGELRDYNFRTYAPRAVLRDRLHSASLLLAIARRAGMSEPVRALVERLWRHLGRYQVVWGAKWTTRDFHSLEFYVYNREEPRPLRLRSVEGLQAALAPLLDGFAPPGPRCRYTMASFDIDADGVKAGRASGLHVYVAGGTEKRRHESFSYGLTDTGLRLENHYTWYYAASELDELRNRLGWSAWAGDADADLLLPPRLCDCLTISYATKPAHDGVYFNRVPTAALADFARAHLPVWVSATLAAEERRFDHLLWDVGFDFTRAAGGVQRVKFGIYGCV